jgi:hypothetical protein
MKKWLTLPTWMRQYNTVMLVCGVFYKDDGHWK